MSEDPSEGVNAGYALLLYSRYLADPVSIDPAWRRYFELHGPPGDGRVAARAEAGIAGPIVGAMGLVRAYRDFGYLGADLDPLGSAPPGDPALDPAAHGLTPELMAAIPAAALGVDLSGDTLADVLPALRATYAGTTAYEVEHIANHRERAWLRHEIESGEQRRPLSADDQRALLARLTQVEALELFLQRAYLGQKRFSIEGLDVLVPMLDLAIALAGDAGAHEVVLGMAHRGRLNMLAHIVGVPYASILEEFEAGAGSDEGLVPRGPTDDVKYHHGARGTYRTAGREIAIALAPNPSHLEAVDPVVEGRARAIQTDRRLAGEGSSVPTRDVRAAVPILIHGDAAFAAQGVVAETFNLARLPGYTTGGTIHLIANNQIGFTTTPREGRSTDYASDLAKGFDVPIVHVNADDPQACLDAIRLAMAYRREFSGDVVIDVVGYRRHGHNEGDEPAYTQPLMAERIQATPSVRVKTARRLVAASVIDQAGADEQARLALERLDAIREETRGRRAQRWTEPREVAPGARVREPATAVPAVRLRELNEGLLAVPAGFAVHPKLLRPFERRRESIDGDGPLDWGQAESLALASLLGDGVPVRLTGQDTERGTFSQRHLGLFDTRSGARYAPIEHLTEASATVEVFNSPLSEYACLGFEYGYAAGAPEALVIWEAQYGDFVNAAEVIVDQFIVGGLAKWGETSRLTLLLPHGFEGSGPEHSSARLERFLALCAKGNLRVANPSTPAQYFHLLRRQGLHPVLRPLVVMTPKSLLRLPEATSPAHELSDGRFAPVLAPLGVGEPGTVRRLVLCSGKFFYDLARSELATRSPDVAVARIELLYPFPAREIASLLKGFSGLERLVWAQEEPRNMGALKFVLPELARLLPAGVEIETVARPERSSPAEGYGAVHQAEQRRLVREAFSGTRSRSAQPESVVPWRSP
jgi:2-oxoglutarate dehydrogenase E1 component